MFDDLRFLELCGIDNSISYPLQMDFYAIDKIQQKYGNYSNWVKALGMDKENINILDANIEDILWTIVLFINEGIKINNRNNNENMELITTEHLIKLCKNNNILELKFSFMQLIYQVLEASNGIPDKEELPELDVESLSDKYVDTFYEFEEEEEEERKRSEIINEEIDKNKENNDIYINLEPMVLLCMKMGYSEYEAGLMTIKKFTKIKLAYQNVFDTELCLLLNRKTYSQLKK